ncbi:MULTISPECIES: hypothetical protein [Sphingobium]|jgi:hypothetical protein|uniref:Uncharacterized protein n=2 Tax=Sphingobium TaxID=165695 RepID=A0A085K4M8_SPHYA|nr:MULTISPECIES: hypothetical protein [Sphingobium]AYO78737.1 hypothetical protein EBF16_18665 [Sphingobium yanoikuyae]KEZ13034.1 hypothetical protein CP98_05016 [Sphingobium yanoikuyae]KFD27674.1 hypothetical protein IH86_13630 [Sphingobium yanoikuyae]KZC75402.1 hypothetical protein AYR46_21175 [Sphingobium yanoikuyae]MDG2513892.1 hypothetical protein [Sphingobium yanoikuyae]|tara:strand:+ start:8057 stop:8830 length:774 start_codon:yes stop_codon:yes gene_type:complete
MIISAHHAFGIVTLVLFGAFEAMPARAANEDPRYAPLLVASNARLLHGIPVAHAPKTYALAVATPTDHFDLARVRSRSLNLLLGPSSLRLSANRAASFVHQDGSADQDRWSLRSISFNAAIPLMDMLNLSLNGDYAHMGRRLHVVEINPRRLSTNIASIGLAIDDARGSRLSLDYRSISRPSRHDALTRLAETLGGAPLTGSGPELALASPAPGVSGSIDWRLCVSDMRRPAMDLTGLEGSAIVNDARALASFRYHL